MRARSRTDRYALTASPFYGLKGLGQLSALLKLEPSELDGLRKAHDRYGEWDEETRPGKVRHIENPPRDLKRVQSRLAKLLMRIVPPDYLFCPVARRGPTQNAEVHFGAAQVWCIDVKEYFPRTPRERVFRFFREQMGCAGDVAGALTDLTCFNGHLPTGAPSSPILAFFAYRLAWNAIEAACLEFRCRVTLWVDDLTVSGDHVPSALRWRIQKIMRSAGLRYHKEQFGHGRKMTVTGAVVSERDFELPNAFHRGVRETRRDIRRAAEGDRADLKRKLDGKLAYGLTVETRRREMVNSPT